MKKKTKPPVIEKTNNKKEILIGIIPSVLALFLFGLSYIIPSIPEKMKLTVMLLIYFIITLIIFIISLFRSPNKFTMSWAIPLVMFTLFMGSDSVWQKELLWNKNYPIIYSINILIILLFIAVLCHSSKIKINSLVQEFIQKPEPFYEKMIAIFTVFIFIAATWWIINQITCTAIYYMPQKEVHYNAKITSTGAVHGKYYHHRYWNIELSNGKKEVFWVYAAANTETGYTCSTIHDPDPGSVLYLSGKQNFLGFSYQKVDSIIGKEGKKKCP
ncbi:hypothetical protein HZQ44_09125 [Elizabethkingia anophelis]|nr:hypothetical protein [Elizabethkingia anophelis]MCT3695244.1 hypothetical protein [Elizabethkingia anophelis]MCT3859315.1 hypothetical protein [Elizabethkingia anophelis]MCT3912627.1 hypothetical protein [Elizabethkingia anophelis]MCT4311653.1 hypothetical protein [Elizabethkingia anophelis]